MSARSASPQDPARQYGDLNHVTCPGTDDLQLHEIDLRPGHASEDSNLAQLCRDTTRGSHDVKARKEQGLDASAFW